ncbi:cAMP-activated global transcriptional regulator CRP [Streptomyces sp. YIM 121038]|uniref:Crp/Fnr family transcriptional regulator n=1 Tax=Streptomyces sp. YIM 121038 TaxID=2136401 RepID=UPI0011104B94|nr:Crp/Fnr family transcriptional regulator [Streptomyces sp. YIM 121038]QCX80712.1 cAMP-activated global transcriptional regulator CRP [Streptomyces sp. YIM 121038]
MSLIEQEQPLLDALRPRDRAALLALGTPRGYASGEVLVPERATTSYVVAILGGWAVVSVATERGQRLILALRGAGELVGELAAVDRRPRSATVTALGRVDAVVIPGDRFRGFLGSSPAVSVLVLRQLSSRLRSSDGERRSLASENVLQRLAARLVELAHRAGRHHPDGSVTIDLPLPQHDLAASVGSTREAVAKALRLLREQGVVRTGTRRLTVTDVELLRLLAGEGPSGAGPVV